MILIGGKLSELRWEYFIRLTRERAKIKFTLFSENFFKYLS